MLKVVMGPEQIVLDREEYPITFGTLSAIQTYNSECKKAQTFYDEIIKRAAEDRDKVFSSALDKLKRSLT